MLKGNWGVFTGLLILGLMLAGCGGGGDTVNNSFVGAGGDPPGIVGDLSAQLQPGDYPQQGEVQGALDSAPLGTDPLYEVQEADDVIETRPVSGTSSIGKGASDDNPLFWVAITHRGEDPVPGNAAPPFNEGDEVDLYMRYQVYEDHLTISRTWYIGAAGLAYTEPSVTHPQPGAYEAIFPFTLPYGSAALDAKFIGAWGSGHTPSAFVVPDMVDYREVEFEIETTTVLPPVNYPPVVPPDNDEPVGCMPEWITVDWTSSTEVHVEAEKELSNVVLAFEDGEHEKWDDLDLDPDRVYEGDFWGTGDNEGKTIVTVWVKAGCNDSGDGPGYGERFDSGGGEVLGMAQLAWEDLLAGSDYDYNDFVGRMRCTETRNASDQLVQVDITIKAIARAAGYDSDWQFNVGASFPTVAEMDVIAIVDQFYADGTRHGNQRIYFSAGGMSVPVFVPLREALPNPPGSYATNGVPGTQFIDGDYAELTIILNMPVSQGDYTPMPYEPEILVHPYGGGVYTIGLWTKPGDWTDSYGRPLGFIVPDTYAWPLEGRPIWNCYDGFPYWIEWINDQELDEPELMWFDDTPVETLVFTRDKFTPWPED